MNCTRHGEIFTDNQQCPSCLIESQNKTAKSGRNKLQVMRIWRNQLNKGLPSIRHSEDGAVNVVLAVHHPKIYAEDGSNSYIPPWTICNTAYYCKNPDEYLGWIDLEDLQFDKYKA